MMFDPIYLLVPFAVLPVVLLFRFIGCGELLTVSEEDPAPPPPPAAKPPKKKGSPFAEIGDRAGVFIDPPPNYRKYILGEQPNPGKVKNSGVMVDGNAVIGYWRLVDPLGAKTAADEKKTRPGNYVSGTSLNDDPPGGTLGGSEAANGAIFEGQTGLIVSDPTSLCRLYNGGYIQIPYVKGLYTPEFTIEAWIDVQTLKADYEHALFSTGGHYAVTGQGALDRGFRLFADRGGHWQVRLGNDDVAMFATPPLVPIGGRTHVALVVKNHDATGVKKDLTLYVEGKLAATSAMAGVDYGVPDDAPLFIGIENTAVAPNQAVKLRAPFIGQIQEVVLHNKPLAQPEIENHVDINRH